MIGWARIGALLKWHLILRDVITGLVVACARHELTVMPSGWREQPPPNAMLCGVCTANEFAMGSGL